MMNNNKYILKIIIENKVTKDFLLIIHAIWRRCEGRKLMKNI